MARWSDESSSRRLPKPNIIQEEEAQHHSRFLTGRQVAWMIFDHLRISDTEKTVLDLSDQLKVELRKDNL